MFILWNVLIQQRTWRFLQPSEVMVLVPLILLSEISLRRTLISTFFLAVESVLKRQSDFIVFKLACIQPYQIIVIDDFGNGLGRIIIEFPDVSTLVAYSIFAAVGFCTDYFTIPRAGNFCRPYSKLLQNLFLEKYCLSFFRSD